MREIVKYYIIVFLFIGSFFGIGISFFDANFSAMLICMIFFILSVIFLIVWFVKRKKQKKKDDKYMHELRMNNQAPILSSFCTHCNGLPLEKNTTCRLTIRQNMVYIASETVMFQIPMERIRSVDVLTQKQTETVLNENFGRTLLASLLFGELGALISIEHSFKEKEKTVLEENLVITYEKDGNAKFIALKDLPYEKVISEIKKYVTLTPKPIELSKPTEL